MAKIDPNSLTWRAVLQFIEQQREEAIIDLIADMSAEQQRGIIRVLDKLKALPDETAHQPVIQDDYT